MVNVLSVGHTARGTQILLGALAYKRRKLLSDLVAIATANGFSEIVLPSIERTEMYTDKMGAEVLNQMYVFPDKKGRSLCLRPEGTATCQALAREHFQRQKDVCFFYETRCWRYERPQAGRYREFTQFGVEVLWPSKEWRAELIELAVQMVRATTDEYTVNTHAKRGLAYYVGDGFEISCDSLGAQKQVCGGGSYAEGIGFALGVDRLLLLGV